MKHYTYILFRDILSNQCLQNKWTSTLRIESDKFSLLIDRCGLPLLISVSLIQCIVLQIIVSFCYFSFEHCIVCPSSIYGGLQKRFLQMRLCSKPFFSCTCSILAAELHRLDNFLLYTITYRHIQLLSGILVTC